MLHTIDNDKGEGNEESDNHHNAIKGKRRNRNPRRERAITDMHDLMYQELPDNEIMKLLNLPQKKYYRYRQELFEQEKLVAQELLSDDEVLFQLSILRDRLGMPTL
jgi:hypothetical protein